MCVLISRQTSLKADMLFVAGLVMGFIVGSAVTSFIYKDSVLADKVKAIKEEGYEPKQITEQEKKAKVGGMVFMPESEQDVARKEIIERNNKLGVDTPIESLR